MRGARRKHSGNSTISSTSLARPFRELCLIGSDRPRPWNPVNLTAKTAVSFVRRGMRLAAGGHGATGPPGKMAGLPPDRGAPRWREKTSEETSSATAPGLERPVRSGPEGRSIGLAVRQYPVTVCARPPPGIRPFRELVLELVPARAHELVISPQDMLRM